MHRSKKTFVHLRHSLTQAVVKVPARRAERMLKTVYWRRVTV